MSIKLFESLPKLVSIGLSEQKAKETCKNETLTSTLLTAIDEGKKFGKITKEKGVLLYHASSKMKLQILHHLPLISQYIVENKLDNVQRIDVALGYLLSNVHREINLNEFEVVCGIGVTITPEDVERAVEAAITKYKNQIQEERYRFNLGIILQEVRKTLKWADFKDVKNEVEVQLLYILGPKNVDDLQPQVGKVKNKSNEGNVTKTEIVHSEVTGVSDMIQKLQLHKPGENYKTDGYIVTSLTEELIRKHLSITQGQVRTRFPPEPNGILHIGHAKAININFGYAEYHKGICFLRYDDTNPEKEEDKFFKGILETVQWLGWKPYKITYSSDYFDQLYIWARELIILGLAYVCHQKQEELKGFNPPPSPFRNRSVEENLLLFEDMKNGKMDEGECTLRMKVTLEEGKQDPVAYRIKYKAHVRTGNKWCIYPTYDYAHCLCDSLEHITHSLCTKEFQSRRSAYYWLCNALNIYCPVQWEYGRLNMNYSVVSKRKIGKLIDEGIVKDWDDPRLFTLSALRRRGYPPSAINLFCAKVGVTGALMSIDPSMLEACVRDELNVRAPRAMVVIEPLEVQIINAESINILSTLKVPDFPAFPDNSSHTVQLSNIIYIEQHDFRKMSDKNYKRLTLSQAVGLRYTQYILKVTDVQLDENNVVTKLLVRAEQVTQDNKPKAFIHWVSKPVEVTVRMYSNLFLHPNPEDTNQVPNGFLSDINKESLVEKRGLADVSLLESSKYIKQYQFERVGYFSLDPDSNIPSHLIFNLTAKLKEDGKK